MGLLFRKIILWIILKKGLYLATPVGRGFFNGIYCRKVT